MTDETISQGYRWECPHCGTNNGVDSDEWEDNEFGFLDCNECENFVRLESSIRVEFVASAIVPADISSVIKRLDISAQDTEQIECLAESIDTDYVDNIEAARKLVSDNFTLVIPPGLAPTSQII